MSRVQAGQEPATAATPCPDTWASAAVMTAAQASARPAATASSSARRFPEAVSPVAAAATAAAEVTAVPSAAPPVPGPGTGAGPAEVSAVNTMIPARTAAPAVQTVRGTGRPDRTRTIATLTISSAATIICTTARGPDRRATACTANPAACTARPSSHSG